MMTSYDPAKLLRPGLDPLLLRLAAHDSDCDWTALIDWFGDDIRRVCLRHLLSGSQVEDAFQETFLRIQRALASYQPGSEPQATAWLHQSAIWACRDLNRAEQARCQREQQFARESQAQAEAQATPRLEDVVIQRLKRALRVLPTNQRHVLEQRYFMARSNQEIAVRLGVSLNSVDLLSRRALRALRARLGSVEAERALGCVALAASSQAPLGTATVAVAARSSATAPILPRLGRRPLAPRTMARPPSRSLASRGILRLVLAILLLAMVGGVAGWDALRSDDSGTRIVLARSTGSVSLTQRGIDDDLPVPGTVLRSGARMRTGTTGGAALVQMGVGQLQVREDTEVSVAAVGSAFGLSRGAVVALSDADRSIVVFTGRAECLVTGTARILSTAAFCRIDVVVGATRISTRTGSQHLVSAGQAMAFGDGCPSQPFAAASEELSPRFGGVFYRQAAIRYAAGRSWVVEPGIEGPVMRDVEIAQAKVPESGGAGATSADVGRVCRTIPGGPGQTPQMAIENRNPEPLPVGIQFARWSTAPAGCLVTELTVGAITDGGRQWTYGLSSAGGICALASTRWQPSSPWFTARPMPVTTVSPRDDHTIRHVAMVVGMLPDGRTIWEAWHRHGATHWMVSPTSVDRVQFLIPPSCGLTVRRLRWGIMPRSADQSDPITAIDAGAGAAPNDRRQHIR